MKSKKIERDKQSNKQCKEGRQQRNAQEVREKKEQQKAFLCSTLMKSYAFVVMLLPSYMYTCAMLKSLRLLLFRGVLNYGKKETSAMQ